MEIRRGDGTVVSPFGPDALGMISYDAQGHMAAQIMRRGRPAFVGNDPFRGAPEENQAATAGYVAYMGAYELREGGTVVHHVEGSLFPNWIGGQQVRFWQFSGDQLVLRTPPITVGGSALTNMLVWERVA